MRRLYHEVYARKRVRPDLRQRSEHPGWMTFLCFPQSIRKTKRTLHVMVYTISCDIPHDERKGKSKQGPQTYFPVLPTETCVIRHAMEDEAVQPVAGQRIADTKRFKLTRGFARASQCSSARSREIEL